MTDHEDLFWTAFRYASGELSMADEAAFDERLEHDQAAREALARAVELTAAVRAIPEPIELAVRSESWRRHVGRVAAALAVMLAGVMAVQVLWLDRGQPQIAHHDADDPTTGLALAWVRTHDQIPADFDFALIEELADAGELWTPEVELEDTTSPPSWMIAAVTIPDDSDISGQEN